MIYHLILNLIVAHVIADFYLQTNTFCRKKAEQGVKGPQLWIHSLVVGVFSWVVVGDVGGWWLALLLMIFHFLTDWLKPKAEYWLRKWLKDWPWGGLTVFLAD